MIEGKTTTSDNKPLANINVKAYANSVTTYPIQITRTDQDGTYQLNSLLVYVFTDNTGRFRLDGLSEGDYRLRFSDPNHAFTSIYYGSVFTFEDAAVLTLSNTAVRTDVNVDMNQVGDSKSHVYLPVIGR